MGSGRTQLLRLNVESHLVSDLILPLLRKEKQWISIVHKAVVQDFPDLSGHQVYACGAPIVVDSARAEFSRMCGLVPDEFYADSFTTEADKAREAAKA